MHVTYADDAPFYRTQEHVHHVPRNATVLVGGGLHYLEMTQAVAERVFHRPEFRHASRRVCMTIPAPGSNKPARFLERQGPGPTEAYNQLIRDVACRGRHDLVLEAFQVLVYAYIPATTSCSRPSRCLYMCIFQVLVMRLPTSCLCLCSCLCLHSPEPISRSRPCT